MEWEFLDAETLFKLRDAQHESTTSANVGAFVRPIGGMLRRQVPGMEPCVDGKECTVNHQRWRELYGKK